MPTTAPSNSNVQDIISDARWLPSRLEAATGALEFTWLARGEHGKVSFLSDQYLQQLDPPKARVRLADLQSPQRSTQQNCHYIFHSAFCRSTLLTRALDIAGTSFGLNEPQILIDLAVSMRQGKLNQELLQAAVALLSRPFAAGEAVIVKPGNEANLLIDPLMRLDDRSKAIILYAPLAQFLRSIARKQLWGRLWVRRLFLLVRQDYKLSLGFTEAELFEQTDLQVAAMAWLHHHAQFASLLKTFPGRFKTLDSESFLTKRSQALSAIGAFFELDIDAKRWADVAEGAVFNRHSKEIGRTFSPEDEGERNAVLPLIDEEIEMVISWTKTVAEQIGLTLDLPDAVGTA